MAGLYRRGVQRNAGTPMMQVQGSQGAGGAIPRGASLPSASQDNAKTSENVQKLGGLLGMLNQQKQAQEEIAPAMGAAEQSTQAASALPDFTRDSLAFERAPSMNGEWGGMQSSVLGPGVPAPTGEFQLNSGIGGGMNLSSVPSMGGSALPNPAMGQMPGAIANVGGDFMNAGQQAMNAASNAGQVAAENLPSLTNFFDLFKFGGGAGA